MKNRRRIYWLFNISAVAVFITVLTIHCLASINNKSLNKNTNENNNLCETNTREMRAVWVSFLDLDLSNTDYSENAFKNKFDKIVDDSKKLNLNTLIVQVRPFSDALYQSKIYPWSHIVAKEQGENPGYDPLKYMVKKAHKNGLKIHAWVNPLRVQVNNTPNKLSESNPFYKYQNDLVVDFGNEKYYNPGYSNIRELIINGVKEIVANYDVDGVQIDDYFYPRNRENFDTACYNNYIEKAGHSLFLPYNEWRYSNINSLVSGIFSAIKSIKPNVVFGISPEGNITNNIALGADVRSWCQMPGYVDYICPQLYFNFENPVIPFEKAINEWKSIVTNKDIKLYYGLGLYKAGSEEDNGTWKKSDDILMNQIQYARETGCDGFMLFSYNYLVMPQTENEIKNVMKVFD